MKVLALVYIFLLATFAGVQAQDTTAISKKRIRFLAVGSAVTYTGAMIGLNSTWYSQYDRQSFRFFNDAAEWKQMDKIGHLYSSFQIASGSSRVIRWSGLSEKKSDRIAVLTSFGVMASIELLDGLSAGYGASASDLLYNASGIGLYWGQKLVWKEIRIHPKLSFHKSEYAALRPNVLGATLAEQILKDYNGETQWLSLDLDKFNDRFPKWLNIAIGYGAEEMIYARDYPNNAAGLFPYRQFYLALDFDVTSIHSKSKAVNTLLYVLNMVKLPAPTLEFSNKKIRGHYFYF